MLRRLFGSIRQYRRNAILAPIFVALEVVLDVIIPYLMAKIIDRGIAASSMHWIYLIGLALVGCALLSLVFGIMSGRHAAVASAGLAANLRRDMFAHIQEFAFQNIDKFSQASLVTRLTTDITNVQNATQMLLRILVRSPLMLTFSLLMAFKVNGTVSLVFLAVAPVLAIGLYLIITRAHPIFEQVIRTYDRLNTVVRENLRGIRVVKAFVREEDEIDKFKAVSSDIYTGFYRAERLLNLNSPLMQFAMYSCTLLLSWIGAQLIVTSRMTTGQLMGLLSYASQILMSLNMLSMVLMMMTVSRASAERIVAVLDEQPALADPPNPVTTVADGSVEFRDATFGYGSCDETMCLEHITLDIPSGSTIGIIGGTGSGKTTLSQLIPRLYDVAEGAVLVGGRDVREYGIQALRQQVAMVLQKNILFAGTVRENLLWGDQNATDAELLEACRLARADEFLSTMPDGLDSHIEQGGKNLSGGQRQRLCIARALVKKPKIIILDDSTSAVDSKTDQEIRKALRTDLAGITTIIIGQRIASVMDADKIIVMEAGKIDGFASHDELLRTNAIYQEVYNSQIRKGSDHDAA